MLGVSRFGACLFLEFASFKLKPGSSGLFHVFLSRVTYSLREGDEAIAAMAAFVCCLLLGRVIEFDSCCVIDSVTRRYALTDSQWNCIKDLLPSRAGHVGAPSKNNRLFVDAELYRYRAGMAWRDVPERFGDFRVIHTRHSAGVDLVFGSVCLKRSALKRTTNTP